MRLAEPLVLASQSPRRREILTRLGLDFEVRPAEVAEIPAAGEAPDVYAARLARDKARAIASSMKQATVLGADTIVVCGDVLMEKPRDDDDALRMLTLLSGNWHTVTTAVCVCDARGAVHERSVRTEVRFRDLPEAALRRYVATGEGRDKAGSYGIQDLGSGLVAEVRGSYTNVVGLPAAETLDLLGEAGALEQWP